MSHNKFIAPYWVFPLWSLQMNAYHNISGLTSQIKRVKLDSSACHMYWEYNTEDACTQLIDKIIEYAERNTVHLPLKKSEHQVLCKQRSKMDNIMRSFQTFSLERNQEKKRETVQQFVVIGKKGKIVMKMTMGIETVIKEVF